jgi:type VI secretion system secreted protein VgrG
VLDLTAGAVRKLSGHPLLGDLELLIVEVEHEADFGDADATPSGARGYTNRFRAVSAAVPYRPARVTPRPRIHGLVTGMIALGAHGAVGGRAQLDDDGRYVVQLHFDTVVHEGEEKASHPIRMAQPFAGPNHGMHFPLRPGAEVVIAFLDGDPDRPIIVGSVPNAMAPSATTSANSHQNRIQSATGIVFQFSENK